MSHHRSHRRARRVIAQLGSGALLVAGVTVFAATATAPMANAAGGAISTTTNIADGSAFCVNPDGTGEPEDPTNCNAYPAKSDVWLSNLPQNLPEGDYFFAVNVPGSQATPNDGADGLLSSDPRSERTFHVDGDGLISSVGAHPISSDGLRIAMAPFADTTNGGGVYVASVCTLPDPADDDVDGNDCKHDSFKVVQDDPPPPADPLAVSKTAAGSYDQTYIWDIDKTVLDGTLSGVSGSVTADYTVTVSHDAGTISGAGIAGSVTVTNPNPASVIADITDTFSDANIICTLTGAGEEVEVVPGDTILPFTCDVAADAVPADGLTNTVTVAWDVQMVGDELLDEGSATDTTEPIEISPNIIDECVIVSDTLAGDLGSFCVGDDPLSVSYPYDFDLTTPGCVTYPNTAAFETTDTGATGDDLENVEVCKTPLNTGAHTIGFWSNKNGQGVISGGAATMGVCNSGAFLRNYAPFQDLSATANCAAVAKYVATVISKATATSMNPMLKAQMLATALSVYFTGPGSTLATQKFLPNTNLGDIVVDLTTVKGKDVSNAFGGATSLSVSAALAYAASQSNVGGGTWYAQNKPVQTNAKDLFDAINNNIVYAP